MNITVQQLIEKKGGEIHAVSPDSTVYDAIKMMSALGVGALIVTEQEKLIGLISERDYTRKVILKDRSSKTTRVKEIMTAKVICVTPDTTVEECMALMSNYQFRHLPVMENNIAIGVVTVMDLLKCILSEKDFIIEQLEQYIAGNA